MHSLLLSENWIAYQYCYSTPHKTFSPLNLSLIHFLSYQHPILLQLQFRRHPRGIIYILHHRRCLTNYIRSASPTASSKLLHLLAPCTSVNAQCRSVYCFIFEYEENNLLVLMMHIPSSSNLNNSLFLLAFGYINQCLTEGRKQITEL